jgi:hypothetical protein
MKKLFTTAFVIVCFIAVSFAQSSSDNSVPKFTLGVFGGLNIPDLTGGGGNELSRDYSSRIGEAFGLTASYSLSSNFALRADALYSSEGGKRNGFQAIEFNPSSPGKYLYANIDNESILNYFEIPVMLKYTIPLCKSSKFYIDFGPYVGFLLNAKEKISGTSNIYEDRAGTIPILPAAISQDSNTTITSSINPINFGLTGGIGITQSIGFGEIFLDVRGAYGLTVIQKNTQDGNNHNGNLLMALGYSVSL